MWWQTMRTVGSMTWRMFWRDWRAGELGFLAVALMIAVGALSSVGFFVDRVGHGLQRDASKMLGADLVISADHPIPANLLGPFNDLQQAQTVNFVSMALTQDENQNKLVTVKAVSTGYPLRGNLALENGVKATGIPDDGSIWIDKSIQAAFNLTVGQTIKLGDKSFVVSHVLGEVPDAGPSAFNIAPLVIFSLNDLEQTHLILPGSRINYRLLVAGDLSRIEALQKYLDQTIAAKHLKGINVDSIATGRPELKTTLDRATQFLTLVSLLSAMLAALAIALSARRFMERHIDAYAMLRCLGMQQNQVVMMFIFEFLLVGVLASIAGAALGFLGHQGLLVWLGSFITVDLPSVSFVPALQGIAIGLLLLLGFGIPPLIQLRNVPHNLMVRRVSAAPRANTILVYVLGLAMFSVLLVWQTQNIKLAGYTLAGFLLGFASFSLLAWLFLKLLKSLRPGVKNPAWRFAITGLQRRPASSVVQIVALALGLMALLLLTVIRADLLNDWREATPKNAPNQFVINIQPDQIQRVEDLFSENKLATPEFYPMIRGRLVAVNGTETGAKHYDDDTGKRMIEREFNLSTMLALPNHNTITAGHWFDNRQPEASVEEGIAKTLHLKVGDILRFNVAGQMVEAPITSLRKLEWSSMQVNFFVIINPAAMQGLPASWITSFHLPEGRDSFIPELSRTFSNLTVIDMGAVVRQLQSILDQVVDAVQFLFLFTIICGLLVLYAALQSSHQQRLQEAGLLRALGASKKQLNQSQWIEFGLLGSVAGLLAATGAAITGWVLASQVFEFPFHPSPILWLAGLIGGALCALAGAWLGLRHILNQPPILSLREV